MIGEHGAKPGASIPIGSGCDGSVGAEYAVAGEIEEVDAIADVGIIDLTEEIGGLGERGVDLKEGASEEGVQEEIGGSDGRGGGGV
ncbi:hypothetical protein IEQ34_011962 [Dendrobium chrysotoxum]|uniref:Uncharacterized protein n=1 Tax=Dendrobium chrysotoxum TaxID=161865 RepID=A0AAV7GTX8_DENCH|nr:hypothetical protein IEQ34_011962 [Dendrobium chrysotoxum]